MSSFVELMGNVRWSEVDIVGRMEAMIREHCSATEEMILHRKMIGALYGFYTLTAQEQAEVAAYAQVCGAAQLAGRAARDDMVLLLQAISVEAAQARLSLPAVEPGPDGEDNGSAADAQERASAQAVVDGASQAVLDLVAQRAAARPEPEPELPAEEQPEEV